MKYLQVWGGKYCTKVGISGLHILLCRRQLRVEIWGSLMAVFAKCVNSGRKSKRNLLAMASNPRAMASNLLGMALYSDGLHPKTSSLGHLHPPSPLLGSFLLCCVALHAFRATSRPSKITDLTHSQCCIEKCVITGIGGLMHICVQRVLQRSEVDSEVVLVFACICHCLTVHY